MHLKNGRPNYPVVVCSATIRFCANRARETVVEIPVDVMLQVTPALWIPDRDPQGFIGLARPGPVAPGQPSHHSHTNTAGLPRTRRSDGWVRQSLAPVTQRPVPRETVHEPSLSDSPSALISEQRTYLSVAPQHELQLSNLHSYILGCVCHDWLLPSSLRDAPCT